MTTKLSIVIPCYNETETLDQCIERVRSIANDALDLEIVIVDDASSDDSLARAQALAEVHPEIRVFGHAVNQGKGAALRTGFREVTGDFVAVQDADLEYDPKDLLRLIEPLEAGKADIVLGSRFLSGGSHRVLNYWHSLGNRFLTLLSNLVTDLHLTDLETCYKVFRREVIQSIEIEENRFGFEPEVVAKLAARKVRFYEMGISYDGRSYDEGKKIGASDGFRAIYCILKYNAQTAPIGVQFAVYLMIGAIAALVNFVVFGLLIGAGSGLGPSLVLAYGVAAAVNYALCVYLLFPTSGSAPFSSRTGTYLVVVLLLGALDFGMTRWLIGDGYGAMTAKALASASLPVLNFIARRFLVFSAAELKGHNGEGATHDA